MTPADAAWLLGLLALHGLAMPADPPQAQHWFERAQMLGHPLAPAGLAWCRRSGSVAAPNPVAAMHWIALVRRTEPGLAKYLQWHAAKALAPMDEPRAAAPARDAGALAPPPSSPTLLKLLTEASRAGNAQARNELGLEYLAAGDFEKALAQFQSASTRSEAAAANASLLTSRIQSGPAGGARSARYSAADWYIEARRYHQGDGVPANYTEAVRLYQIAASSGDPQARRMLALIFSRPLAAIVAGSKVSTKLTILQSLADKVDQLIVGGGIANTFMLAAGLPIGKSLAEPDLLDAAKSVMAAMKARGAEVPIPTDVVVAKTFSADAPATVKAATDVAADDMILDIGPETASRLAAHYLTTTSGRARALTWS
eukprot:gene46767-58317_t